MRLVFGYPGDGINGVFGALNRAEGKLQFIPARHEEMAAFMASAYAKFFGELGRCIAARDPGLIAFIVLLGLWLEYPYWQAGSVGPLSKNEERLQ